MGIVKIEQLADPHREMQGGAQRMGPRAGTRSSLRRVFMIVNGIAENFRQAPAAEHFGGDLCMVDA